MYVRELFQKSGVINVVDKYGAKGGRDQGSCGAAAAVLSTSDDWFFVGYGYRTWWRGCPRWQPTFRLPKQMTCLLVRGMRSVGRLAREASYVVTKRLSRLSCACRIIYRSAAFLCIQKVAEEAMSVAPPGPELDPRRAGHASCYA